jgi:hypothetical protein
MERTYYPSIKRVILFFYIAPAIAWLVGIGAASIEHFVRGEPIASFDWVGFLTFWIIWAGLRALSDGLRAERLAIKITPASISGPLVVGKAVPIPFTQIDYQKTLNPGLFARIFSPNRIYSLSKDQISVPEAILEPEQVSEIWSIIKEKEAQHQVKK